MSSHLLIAILIGGMVAGILDIGAAAAINRKGPVAILHVIASGLLGAKALKGGSLTAALGFLLQLAMSIAIAAIYGLASLWLPILARMWIATGLVYGVGVFVVMTYVVVPLSAAPSRPTPGISKITKDLLAMLGFGLIVALAVHQAASGLEPAKEFNLTDAVFGRECLHVVTTEGKRIQATQTSRRG